ncbi:type II toxin-antitoxin system VapC family toxin [Geoalkalibacter halelectricus]|uniref:Ribonuclease VapC n=1 Tax=Geoalkalibacter halelectricus TaxID=2847045 RepID=A0ABY5ZPZ1_9BACT|nr:type II toxin-antitoxin system VapC family toxin [Geoalkalibacter halelectricus]MDO3378737.1 type II toxin-antitoxin system VapC family toxin [Geoalkalibacter halelectricus]UWZ79955.1 type II toxin-antitoxin system VapC family toxin [Geoalkalibacter halelectricus]
MSDILLDTNVLSELMRPHPDRQVLAWFSRHAGLRLSISAVTKAEILFGIGLLPKGKRRTALEAAAHEMFEEDFGKNCLAFDALAADFYADVVLGRRRAGLPITTEDAQIAAIALSHKMPLATRNTRDFAKIDGLTIIDPWNDE